MKHAHLSYHKEFPNCPVSSASGAKYIAFACPKMENGKVSKPVPVKHPLMVKRKLWCMLRVEVNGVELRFATPDELDIVIDTLKQTRLPSRTTRLFHGPEASRKNRPNDNWFSRLPAKAKSPRWRPVFVSYVAKAKLVQTFRDFYAADPPLWTWDGQDAEDLFCRDAPAIRHYRASNN